MKILNFMFYCLHSAMSKRSWVEDRYQRAAIVLSTIIFGILLQIFATIITVARFKVPIPFIGGTSLIPVILIYLYYMKEINYKKVLEYYSYRNPKKDRWIGALIAIIGYLQFIVFMFIGMHLKYKYGL